MIQLKLELQRPQFRPVNPPQNARRRLVNPAIQKLHLLQLRPFGHSQSFRHFHSDHKLGQFQDPQMWNEHSASRQ